MRAVGDLVREKRFVERKMKTSSVKIMKYAK